MPERRMAETHGFPPRSPRLLTRPAADGGTTVLALDYGEKRIGVAVGDLALRTAHPLAVIDAQGSARFASIARLVAEWHPARLVVGLPCADGGASHPLADRIARFARRLEGRFGLPVAFVDERYSSAEAEARVREAHGARRAARASRAKALDSHAAQLILEQYLAEAGR